MILIILFSHQKVKASLVSSDVEILQNRMHKMAHPSSIKMAADKIIQYYKLKGENLSTESIMLSKCIYASKSTDPIAAFKPFLDYQKSKTKENFTRFIVTICPGDSDDIPFLHASIPAGNTRSAFINFVSTLIDGLTLQFAIEPTKRNALEAGILTESDFGKRESKKGNLCDPVTLPTADQDPHGEQFKIDSWNHIGSFVYDVLQRKLKRMGIEAALADEAIFAEGSGIRDEVVKLSGINPKDSELRHFLSAMHPAVFR